MSKSSIHTLLRPLAKQMHANKIINIALVNFSSRLFMIHIFIVRIFTVDCSNKTNTQADGAVHGQKDDKEGPSHTFPDCLQCGIYSRKPYKLLSKHPSVYFT